MIEGQRREAKLLKEDFAYEVNRSSSYIGSSEEKLVRRPWKTWENQLFTI